MLVSRLSSVCTPLSYQEDEHFSLLYRFMGLCGDQHVASTVPWPTTCHDNGGPLLVNSTAQFSNVYCYIYPTDIGALFFLKCIKISTLSHSFIKRLVEALSFSYTQVFQVQRPDLAHFIVYCDVFGEEVLKFLVLKRKNRMIEGEMIFLTSQILVTFFSE